MRLFQGNRAMIEQARMLYVLIRQQEGITRQILSERLDLPATSLNRALDRQLQLGLIEEYDLAESTGGRRPGQYRIVRQAYYLFGLDLSGASGRLVLVDLALQVIDQKELPGIEALLAQGLAETICQTCRNMMEQQKLSAGQFLGLGIGWSALLPSSEQDADDLGAQDNPDKTGKTDGTEMEPAAGPDGPVDLAAVWSAIGESMNIPVYPLKGADAALYAGLWQQNDLADSTFLYLSAGQTIRYAMAARGQLHEINLATDSIGSLLVPDLDRPGSQRLDQIASIPAIVRRFRKSKGAKSLDWQAFCQAAAAGKKKAGLVLAEASCCMAMAIQNMTLLTGGGHLLLGGPALYDLPAYETAIRHELDNLAAKGAELPRLMNHAYGRSMMAVGAAAFVLEMSLSQA